MGDETVEVFVEDLKRWKKLMEDGAAELERRIPGTTEASDPVNELVSDMSDAAIQMEDELPD